MRKPLLILSLPASLVMLAGCDLGDFGSAA